MKRNLNYKQFNSRNLRGAKKENRKMRQAQHTNIGTNNKKEIREIKHTYKDIKRTQPQCCYGSCTHTSTDIHTWV
jgi:putative ribosome biogenesis GTPase RsgA